MALVMPADPSTITGTLKNQYTFGTIDMKFIPQFFKLLWKVCVAGLCCFCTSAKKINGLLAMGVFNCVVLFCPFLINLDRGCFLTPTKV